MISVGGVLGLGLGLGLVLASSPAFAIPYETFVDIDDEADLQDLLISADITQDTFDELLDLLDRGVDLNTADRAALYALPNLTYDDVDRIIAFRELQNGVIRDPADLVAAEVITQDKLYGISAFLLVGEGKKGFVPKGWVQGMTRASISDKLLPPVALRGRFTAQKGLVGGFGATFSRLQIGDPIYDPNRNALLAEPRAYRVRLPKAYLKYEDDAMTLIGGTFRAGFGQRLVFDNSQQYTPNGLYVDDQLFYSQDLASECRESAGDLPTSPCEGAAGSRYITPDWNFRQGLLGAGGGAKRIELEAGWLQAFGWASVSSRSIYQYELVDRGACADPHDDADVACTAPTVYRQPNGDPLAPTSRYAFTTLPNVFSERLTGANVAYFADRRNSVGLTGYIANMKNLVDGIELDTQEWSRIPTGLTYGAGGANFTFGRGWLDLAGEVAFSGDAMPRSTERAAEGGGGPAAILRATATRKKEELELVFRYYSPNYVNPYARPIAQSDEFEGQRARDEIGGRVRYVRTGKNFNIRALLDLWVPPSTLRDDAPSNHATPKLDTYVRADVRTTDELKLGLWLRYQDKDLREGGHDQCFAIASDTTEDGETIPCSGRQFTTIARATYNYDRTLQFTGQVQHQLLDDNILDENAYRQDFALWLVGLYRPTNRMRFRARLRYFDEAIRDERPGEDPDSYLERSISTVLDTALVVRQKDVVRVRFDFKKFLDNRSSTQDREPNPELTLWLTYQAHL